MKEPTLAIITYGVVIMVTPTRAKPITKNRMVGFIVLGLSGVIFNLVSLYPEKQLETYIV